MKKLKFCPCCCDMNQDTFYFLVLALDILSPFAIVGLFVFLGKKTFLHEYFTTYCNFRYYLNIFYIILLIIYSLLIVFLSVVTATVDIGVIIFTFLLISFILFQNYLFSTMEKSIKEDMGFGGVEDPIIESYQEPEVANKPSEKEEEEVKSAQTKQEEKKEESVEL